MNGRRARERRRAAGERERLVAEVLPPVIARFHEFVAFLRGGPFRRSEREVAEQAAAWACMNRAERRRLLGERGDYRFHPLASWKVVPRSRNAR